MWVLWLALLFWTRESTTPVNANLTITGAAKTTFATLSGTALNNYTSYGDKFVAAAGANVVGTLIIDASPDSGITHVRLACTAYTSGSSTGKIILSEPSSVNFVTCK